MSESSFSRSRIAAATIPILFGAVVVLSGTTLYSFYQMNDLRMELVQTRELLATQIADLNKDSAASAEAVSTTDDTVEQLRAEMEETLKQAEEMAGEARQAAARHADDLAYKLQRLQEQQAAQINGDVLDVSNQVSQVRASADDAHAKVGEVSTRLANVKSQADATDGDLRITIAELQSTKGDLGVQSGLIATNSRQLAALKALGERNYIEFQLMKRKETARIGDLYVRLTKTNEKKNQYSIEVIVDDKRVEKKDRTVNEPVQFIVPPTVQPYEFVVNEVSKDMIRGYLSVPKVKVVQSASN